MAARAGGVVMATLGRVGLVTLNSGGLSGVPASEQLPPLAEGESAEYCGKLSLLSKV